MKPRGLCDSQALISLYKLLGEEGYQDAFVRFARAAIINTCCLGVKIFVRVDENIDKKRIRKVFIFGENPLVAGCSPA